MPVAAGHIMEVAFKFKLYNQIVMNIWHFLTINTPTTTDEITSQDDMVNRLRSLGPFDLVTPYMATASSDLVLTNITAQYIYPTRIQRSDFSVSNSGSSPSPCNAPNLSANLQLSTGFAGRKYRGSVHMNGIPNDKYTSGTLTSGQITLYNVFLTALIIPITETAGTGKWGLTILHRSNPITGANTLVTGGFTHDTLRVQRRRTVGVGK